MVFHAYEKYELFQAMTIKTVHRNMRKDENMLSELLLLRLIRRLFFMICLISMAVLCDFTESYAFWSAAGNMDTVRDPVKSGKVSKRDSDMLREIVEEAKNRAAAGDLKQAIDKYTEAIDRSPKDPVLYFERGTLHYRQAVAQPLPEAPKTTVQPDESTAPEPVTEPPPVRDPLSGTTAQCGLALNDFDQAIALNPNYAIFFYMRGVLLSADACPHRNLEAAVADFDQALRLSPANAAFYQERGNVRWKLKQFDQAMKDIDQAILIEPNNYYFFYEKGLIQEQMGKPEAAAENYMQALTFAPSDQMPPFISALKKVRNNNTRILIADFSALIKKRPAVSVFYVQRGMFFGENKKWDSALEDLSTALSLQSDDRDLHFSRGKLFLEAGKKAEALKDFQKACHLSHTDACRYVKIVEREVARDDRWAFFWRSQDNRKYFYDRKHLKTQEGNRKLVRVRIEFDDLEAEHSPAADHTESKGDRNGYTLEWWEFKCSSSQLRISKHSRLSPDDQVIESYPEFEKTFRPVSPESVSGKLARIVCGKAGKKDSTRKPLSSRQDKPIISP